MTAYCYPETVEEAVAELERHGGEARVIAGGTDVLPDLRKGKIAPRCLVDVTRIPELQRIEVGEDWVTIGAAVTFGAMRENAFLRDHVQALVDAAGSVGAAAIQNAATWAGNIVQAMPAADGAIIGIALGAEAEIVGAEGARWEPVEALFTGPGVSTVDPRREVIARLRFPRPRPGTGTAWRRLGRRSALVLPILNCAVRVELDEEDGEVAEAVIALGPVAPRPSRARKAERFLAGRSPRPEVLEEAGEIARSEASPRSSVMRASKAYRLDILPTLVVDALETAVERARGKRVRSRQ
jgi:carbon-monoxide dehydrogenase medium subunit